MNRAAAWAAACALVVTGAAAAPVATTAAVVFQSGPGRFEVSGADAAAARTVVTLAADGWRHLAGPLGLPESFSSPVFCRLVPAAEWTEATPFRVIVEAGGVVSLRLRMDAVASDLIARRALVQALLMRLAVARFGLAEKLSAPLWLELACVHAWRTRAEPAQFDALKQASRGAGSSLDAIMTATRGSAEPEALAGDSFWLLAFLQGASGRDGGWSSLLDRLLGGDEPLGALANCFPGRFADARERELWWQTGRQHLSRARNLPTLEADESQRELEALNRWVFAGEDGSDRVVPLREVLAHAREPVVAAELQRRAAELGQWLPALHPFFRNAGLSLAAVLAEGSGDQARAAALAAFDQDWSEALDLTAASRAALDELERRAPRRDRAGPG